MKTVFSIPLILLILCSGVTVNMSEHYCGGKVVAKNVTLSGRPATCGMESMNTDTSGRNLFETHCCENITLKYTFCNNYIPSFSFNYYADFQTVCVADLPDCFHSDNHIFRSIAEELLRPPGKFVQDFSDPEELCIFRI